MKNAIINLGVIKKVAFALSDLNNQVIYVGGATVGLYINDPAAEDVRPTKDVDISLSLATYAELEIMREELVKRGFKQRSEDTVICRFNYDDIQVDVMNTKAIGWAPANSWFEPGFALREMVAIEGQKIHVLPLAYFIATKFEAYHGRGNNEPRTSHDFEDIVYLLDNRIDLVEQLLQSPLDVKLFLKSEFRKILHDAKKQEAIYGNLYYETQHERYEMIVQKLHDFCSAF